MEYLLAIFVAAAGIPKIVTANAVRCVPMEDQNVQMTPSMLPHNTGYEISGKNDGLCSHGRIPVHNFISRKSKAPYLLMPGPSASASGTVAIPSRRHAVAFARGRFKGFKTTINIWQPKVEQTREFSLSQLWLISSYDRHGMPRNTIEAGWQIYPGHYGGYEPRLFIYWTADGYNNTGCYNLECDGFVQVSSNYVLGGAISNNTSISGSTQVEAEFLVFQDPKTRNWWLRVAGVYIGYWKASVLPDFASGASVVSCGGEVLELKANRHTKTQMGSGEFPSGHYRYAAYHRDIQIVNENFQLQQPRSMATVPVKAPGCYDIGLLQNAGSKSSWGTYFFYGGPGYSSKCTKA